MAYTNAAYLIVISILHSDFSRYQALGLDNFQSGVDNSLIVLSEYNPKHWFGYTDISSIFAPSKPYPWLSDSEFMADFWIPVQAFYSKKEIVINE